MFEILPAFWDFFFSPLLAFDIDSPIFAPIALCLVVLCVFRFVRRIFSWCFSF